jgi:hypothetical protein
MKPDSGQILSALLQAIIDDGVTALSYEEQRIRLAEQLVTERARRLRLLAHLARVQELSGSNDLSAAERRHWRHRLKDLREHLAALEPLPASVEALAGPAN